MVGKLFMHNEMDIHVEYTKAIHVLWLVTDYTCQSERFPGTSVSRIR